MGERGEKGERIDVDLESGLFLTVQLFLRGVRWEARERERRGDRDRVGIRFVLNC